MTALRGIGAAIGVAAGGGATLAPALAEHGGPAMGGGGFGILLPIAIVVALGLGGLWYWDRKKRKRKSKRGKRR